MTTEFRIGTSGYSFKDWAGTVYPEKARAADFLAIYAKDFDTVEINTTYYRIPDAGMFERMLERVPEDFEFVIKLPREFTHQRDCMESATAPFLQALSPLMAAGQLGGVLAQFPQSFHPCADSVDHLRRLAGELEPIGSSIHIEFRHQDWHNPRFFDLLRELDLGFVNVDLPRLRSLPKPSSILTSPTAYHRLHGRNATTWHNPSAGTYRYDYLYNDSELDEWAARIQETAGQAQKVYVFNNNCHKGSSFVDALRLKQRLGLAVREEEETTPSLFSGIEQTDRISGLIERVSRARQAERASLEGFDG